MTQIIINTGQAANDGTGEPLRQAFTEVNNNFSQIWSTGLINSNVAVSNATIQTLQSNQNLILAPNGIGKVQVNTSVVPSFANVYDVGSSTARWSTVYTQYLDVSANLNIDGNIIYNGDLDVSGNLTVQGNIIQVGNIVTETLTIQLANAATTGNAANGSGITVGANDNIATLLYNATGNVWTTNIGISSIGNITAPYFFGNGSQLTGISAGANTGNVTFSDQIVIGTGISNLVSGLYLAPSSSSANAVQYLRVRGDTSYEPTHIHFDTGNNQYFNQFVGDDNKYVLLSNTGNIVINTDDYVGNSAQWTFGTNGSTIFPTLTVDLHNGGTQTGQVLQFGDGNQQAIITGPAPIVEGYNAQRLIIQGQNGNTGEGGDVYVWGGDSQFNGGDIKIYAGDADNGSSGVGGNIHISGGTGQDTGGEISLTGGTTYNGQGAPVVVTGGRGSTTGGAVNLNGGYGDIDGGTITLTAGYGGTNAGGNVDIIGGISANGLSYYGNVNINAGASSWHFDNTGVLTAPGAISAVGNIIGGNITTGGNITGANVVSANTFVSNAFNVVTAGNLSITSQYGLGFTGTILEDNGTLELIANGSGCVVVGWDSTYGNGLGNIATVNFNEVGGGEGNILLRTGNRSATEYNWNFDSTGNLTLPGGMIINGNINTLGTQTALLQPTDNLPLSFIASGANGSVTSFWAEDFANLMTSNIAAIYTPLQNTQTVRVVTGSNGGNIAIYDFDKDGVFSTAQVSATGNVTGGNVLASGYVSATGNITAANFFGNGSTLSNVATQVTGTWTVPVGNSTQSFTVSNIGTYSMWVDCNITNGILAWNATATVTNNNVPVVGAQYAWVYNGGGTPVDFTSIPNQFTGTANTIVRSSTAPSATTNRFDFGINNTSGGNVTVRYGWAQIS